MLQKAHMTTTYGKKILQSQIAMASLYLDWSTLVFR